MLWTKQEQETGQGQEKEQEQEEEEQNLTWGVVMGSSTAEGAGRLEADEAEAEAGVVVEEADVAKPGDDLVTSGQLLQDDGASALDSEANLFWRS